MLIKNVPIQQQVGKNLVPAFASLIQPLINKLIIQPANWPFEQHDKQSAIEQRNQSSI